MLYVLWHQVKCQLRRKFFSETIRIQLLSIQNNHGSSVMRHSQISILRIYTIFSLTGSYLAKDFRIKLNLQTVAQLCEKSVVTA